MAEPQDKRCVVLIIVLLLGFFVFSWWLVQQDLKTRHYGSTHHNEKTSNDVKIQNASENVIKWATANESSHESVKSAQEKRVFKRNANMTSLSGNFNQSEEEANVTDSDLYVQNVTDNAIEVLNVTVFLNKTLLINESSNGTTDLERKLKVVRKWNSRMSILKDVNVFRAHNANYEILSFWIIALFILAIVVLTLHSVFSIRTTLQSLQVEQQFEFKLLS